MNVKIARRRVVIIAGPNGAGKTTASTDVLRGPLLVDHFVNADSIAQGLSAFATEAVALDAARIMLLRLHELASEHADFAFETTLASRTFAPWLTGLIRDGYEFHLVYLWLPSVELAIARVADRVRNGGHDVPEATIRRRYTAGILNFHDLYSPMAASWQVVNNTDTPSVLVAYGSADGQPTVKREEEWARFSHGVSG